MSKSSPGSRLRWSAVAATAAVMSAFLAASPAAAEETTPAVDLSALSGTFIASVRDAGTTTMATFEPDGADYSAIGTSANDIRGVSASSDGQTVAFIAQAAPGEYDALRVLDRSTDQVRTIKTLNSESSGNYFFLPLAVSDDGTRVAWGERGPGEQHLFVSDIAGTQQVKIHSASHLVSVDWSSAGDRLLVSHRPTASGSVDLVSMRPDGTDKAPVTNTVGVNEMYASWSPDGQRIAMLRVDGGGGSITVTNSAGVVEQVVAPNSSSPIVEWSPDGRHLAWFDSEGFPNHGLKVAEVGVAGPPVFLVLPGRPLTQTRFSWVDAAPSATLTAPSDGTRATLGASLGLAFNCDDDVAVVSCDATVDGAPIADGAALPTSVLGEHEVTVTATDTAGNSVTTTGAYWVDYGFSGLTGPVSSTEINTAKAGQTIPFRFRLTDANGNPVLAVTDVTVTSKVVTCGTLDGPADAVEEYTTNGGLQNLGDGWYQFNWKTSKSYAGTCRAATVHLGEGGSATAGFSFAQ